MRRPRPRSGRRATTGPDPGAVVAGSGPDRPGSGHAGSDIRSCRATFFRAGALDRRAPPRWPGARRRAAGSRNRGMTVADRHPASLPPDGGCGRDIAGCGRGPRHRPGQLACRTALYDAARRTRGHPGRRARHRQTLDPVDQRWADGDLLPACRPRDQTGGAGGRALQHGQSRPAGRGRRGRSRRPGTVLPPRQLERPGSAGRLGDPGRHRHSLRAGRAGPPGQPCSLIPEALPAGARHHRRSGRDHHHSAVLLHRPVGHGAGACRAGGGGPRGAEPGRRHPDSGLCAGRRVLMGLRAQIGASTPPWPASSPRSPCRCARRRRRP